MDINDALRIIWSCGLGWACGSTVGIMLLNHVLVRDLDTMPRVMQNITFLITGIDHSGILSWMFMWLILTGLTAISACLVTSSFGTYAAVIIVLITMAWIYGRYKSLQVDP
ncbi:hypothetical protein D9M68_19020 [compost metagenome]